MEDESGFGFPTRSTGEILDEFPELTRDRLKSIIKDLKAEGRVRLAGRTKGGRWYAEASTT